jgi:hypothetical protein
MRAAAARKGASECELICCNTVVPRNAQVRANCTGAKYSAIMAPMTDAERDLAEISPNLSALERLEQALEICAVAPGVPGPNYFDFQAWVLPQLEAERRTIYNATDARSANRLGAAITVRLVELKKRLNKASSLIEFNKLKLLLSIFTEDSRGREVAEVLSGKLEFPEHLTEDLAKATPAELRFRLFAAIGRNKPSDAAFIMGRLDENKLHEGEHDYLHALVRFRSGDLAAAARLADKVPSTAIDGLNAAYLAAKAHAMIGNIESARAALKIAKSSLSPCQWLHLSELACWYNDAGHAESIMAAPLQQLTIHPNDPGYREWGKFHVRILIRMSERFEEISEGIAADSTQDLADVDMVVALFQTDAILKKCLFAFMLDPSTSHGSDPIHTVMLLAPLIERGDREAFHLAYETLYRMKRYDVFMENFVEQWRSGRQQFDESPDLLASALEVACIEGHALVGEIRAALSQVGQEETQGPEIRARRQRISRRLSPMGRQSFLGAAAVLDRAIAQGEIWKDSGLIALGFFRVLEIEINERLIRPTARGVDFAAMRGQVDRLGARSTGWNRRLELLAKTIADDRSGLMLGQIRELLNIGAAHGRQDEEGLRQSLLAAVQQQLTSEGRDALKMRQIQSLISQEHVDKFRNFPAHGSYISLADAQHSEEYVSAALDSLFRWLKAYSVTELD